MKPQPTTTKIRQSKTSGLVRFPGITRHARELGVTRVHLWLCLRKQRQSKSLMRRYRALKRAEAAK